MSSRPESWSDVVVARIRFVEPAGEAAAEAPAEAWEGLAAGALACGLDDAAELQAAATRTSVTSGAIRSSTPRFKITVPGTIAIPPLVPSAAHPHRARVPSGTSVEPVTGTA